MIYDLICAVYLVEGVYWSVKCGSLGKEVTQKREEKGNFGPCRNRTKTNCKLLGGITNPLIGEVRLPSHAILRNRSWVSILWACTTLSLCYVIA